MEDDENAFVDGNNKSALLFLGSGDAILDFNLLSLEETDIVWSYENVDGGAINGVSFDENKLTVTTDTEITYSAEIYIYAKNSTGTTTYGKKKITLEKL